MKSIMAPTRKLILALDQGTTSSRAIVFDARGRIRGMAQREFHQYFPKPGWVEHDPEEIWQSQVWAADKALQKAGVQRREISAVGITNQRETTVLWDRRNGKAVHPAIVWQDRRTSALCRELAGRGETTRFRRHTGLLLDPYFSGTKIAWLLDQKPRLRRLAERGDLAFGTIDSWLLWRLTGGAVHATDASNASRTLLYDIHRGGWHGGLADRLGVPTSLLPDVKDSAGFFGECVAPGALAGLPVTGVAGDQQAALFGQLCHQAGMAKNTYGTGCFLLMHTGDKPVRSRNNLLTTIAWQINGRRDYALEGSVFVGGAVIQWLRDGLGLINTAADSEKLAREAGDSGGVFLVPAFTGLGAPYWDPEARGVMVGLTRGTGVGQIAYAALASIALQSQDLLDAMQRDAGMTLKTLRVDGGASANNLLMQMQADFSRAPVCRPKITETTALGAALLAGLGAGVYKDQAAMAQLWKEDRTFKPKLARSRTNATLKEWHRAVKRSRKWATA